MRSARSLTRRSRSRSGDHKLAAGGRASGTAGGFGGSSTRASTASPPDHRGPRASRRRARSDRRGAGRAGLCHCPARNRVRRGRRVGALGGADGASEGAYPAVAGKLRRACRGDRAERHQGRGRCFRRAVMTCCSPLRRWPASWSSSCGSTCCSPSPTAVSARGPGGRRWRPCTFWRRAAPASTWLLAAAGCLPLSSRSACRRPPCWPCQQSGSVTPRRRAATESGCNGPGSVPCWPRPWRLPRLCSTCWWPGRLRSPPWPLPRRCWCRSA